jgi:hypothetical protein
MGGRFAFCPNSALYALFDSWRDRILGEVSRNLAPLAVGSGHFFTRQRVEAGANCFARISVKPGANAALDGPLEFASQKNTQPFSRRIAVNLPHKPVFLK